MKSRIRITPQIKNMVTAAYRLGVHDGKVQTQRGTPAGREYNAGKASQESGEEMQCTDEAEIQDPSHAPQARQLHTAHSPDGSRAGRSAVAAGGR